MWLQVGLLLLHVRQTVSVMSPKISNTSSFFNGTYISVTSWHARTLTNISWSIPLGVRNMSHVISFVWEEKGTASWLYGNENVSSRATPFPSSTSMSHDDGVLVSDDGPSSNLSCTFRDNAFHSNSKNAFFTDENRAFVTPDLANETTWWYTASLGQKTPTVMTPTSGEGNASVLLSEPGLYSVCLLGDYETCSVEECVSISVYQPLYDFLEVDSTNVGNVVTVRFNIVSRHAYPGDWGWVLGGVDPSVILEEANALSPSETTSVFEERCWFYFGPVIELGHAFLCSSNPDPLLASFQSIPSVRAYTYGRFELFVSSAGNESLWLAKQEQYSYMMIANFYTCGITVQPLDSTTVTTTSDVIVRAVPEHGETCDVNQGIELAIHTDDITPYIEGVDAWIYFTGRTINISYEETTLSIRLPYQGDHIIQVFLTTGAPLDVLNLTAIASDPYAPSCEVIASPASISSIGSPVSLTFKARDFYKNLIIESWGSSAFKAWSFNSVTNVTDARVYDEGNGSFKVVSDFLDVSGTNFFFVERENLGIPGSPFEVHTFGPSTCSSVSMVGECGSDIWRPVQQKWETNSPCRGVFEDPVHDQIACDFVPVASGLSKFIIACSLVAGLYAALYLVWIQRHRQTIIVKLSQPFVCQLFLLGCVLLNLSTMLHLGEPTDMACMVQPWILHVALTFTSSCLYMKTYRVHRIFNSAAKFSRISITDRKLVIWVLEFIAVDVALLIVWTVLDRPRRVDTSKTAYGIEVVTARCSGQFDFPIFSLILWTWKACLNIFGMVMATKTWHCEDGVGESRSICLSVYNTTLLGLINLGIQLLLAHNTAIKVGAATLSAAGGAIFTVSVLFGPKLYHLWSYGDLMTNPVNRRNSYSESHTRRRSATTNNSGVEMDPTRRSSGSLKLDFMKNSKILPITENQIEASATISLSDNRRNHLAPLPRGAICVGKEWPHTEELPD